MKNIVIGLVVLAMVVTSPVIAKAADDEQAVRKVLASCSGLDGGPFLVRG